MSSTSDHTNSPITSLLKMSSTPRERTTLLYTLPVWGHLCHTLNCLTPLHKQGKKSELQKAQNVFIMYKLLIRNKQPSIWSHFFHLCTYFKTLDKD